MSHVKFNAKLLQLRDVEMYKASVAAGGFIYARDNGVDKKIKMPLSVCRLQGDAYYKNPIAIRVLFYGNDAINFMSVESCDNSDGISIAENLKNFKERIEGEKLYYDGKLIYSLDYIDGDVNLDSTNFMKHIKLPTYNPSNLFYETVDVVLYDSVKCKRTIGFPIWSEVGSSLLKFRVKRGDTAILDEVNDKFGVNLQGLLRIAKMSAETFGPESIECFKLVEYMKIHKTVNLPALSSRVRKTSLTGMSYSDVIAFHIGKIKACKDYYSIKVVKESLLYALSYTIISKDLFNKSKIYLTDDAPVLINSLDAQSTK